MTLLPIFYAFSSFLVLFLAQALLHLFWRPQSEDRFIFALYIVLPALAFAVGIAAGAFAPSFFRPPLPAFVLFFALAASWVASYPAIYASCPSLMMSYFLSRSPEGLSGEELVSLLDVKASSAARIGDAHEQKWIRLAGPRVELAFWGRFFAFFFSAYRWLLGRRLNPL